MGPKTEELVTTLEYLIDMLERDGNEHWTIWMKDARNKIIFSDFSGIEKVLNAYGGMGSFNDIYLINLEMENSTFSLLSSKAYQLANEIKHDCEINFI